MPPTTPLIDTFTRTENPIASGWNGPIETAQNVMQTQGSFAEGTVGSAKNSAYWQGVFGPNQEAWFDYDNTQTDVQIYLRTNNQGNAGTFSGFQVQFLISSNQISLWGSFNGGQQDFLITAAAPSNGKALNTGSKAWVQSLGSTRPQINIYVFYTVWELIGTATYASDANSALQGGGKIGMRTFSNTQSIDNFGGGDIPYSIESFGRRPVPMRRGPDRDTLFNLSGALGGIASGTANSAEPSSGLFPSSSLYPD